MTIRTSPNNGAQNWPIGNHFSHMVAFEDLFCSISREAHCSQANNAEIGTVELVYQFSSTTEFKNEQNVLLKSIFQVGLRLWSPTGSQ